MARSSYSSRGGSSRSGSSRGGSRRSGGGSRPRSGGSSRGRGGGSYGRAPAGGGNGPAMAIAIVLVVGAVVAFVALSGGKGKDDDASTGLNVPTRPTQPATSPEPEGPKRMPVPRVDNDLYQQGTALIKQMKPIYEKASGLYDDAQQVKDEDPDMWQTLLRQANDELRGVKDLYNELIGLMPSNDDWDEEQVATHYFGRDYQKIGKLDELQAAIRKNIRSK